MLSKFCIYCIEILLYYVNELRIVLFSECYAEAEVIIYACMKVQLH